MKNETKEQRRTRVRAELSAAAAVVKQDGAAALAEMRRQRDTYQARLVERTEEVERLRQERDAHATALASLRRACQEAERERDHIDERRHELAARVIRLEQQRGVLADALRGAVMALERAGVPQTAEAVRANLRECGLLRPQDDPAMIPAAWLPGAEEEEG